MESHRLNKLAEKYWDGACTDQEEALLKEVLLNEDTPKEHSELAAYLKFQESERNSLTLDADFDKIILERISDTPSSQTEETENGVVRKLKVKGKPKLWYISLIAASFVLIFGLFWMMRDAKPDTTIAAQTHTSEFIDTFENSEEAYREVKKALMMVSSNMNSGMKHTGLLGEFHKATEGVRNDQKKDSKVGG